MFVIASLAAALEHDGWWHSTAGLDSTLCAALHADLRTLDTQQRLVHAGIGRGAAFRVDAAVRSDRIAWLTPSSPAQSALLEGLEALRVGLNRTLYLGLTDIEAHFAQYGPGTSYGRHTDSFVGPANRIVSFVAYLNEEWQADDGGELVLYGADAAEFTRITPRAGTVVAFLSETTPHEVLPSRRRRASIAAWLRRNATPVNRQPRG